MIVQYGQLVAWESAELPKEIHFFRVDSHISQIHVKQFYKKLFIPLTEELPSTRIHTYREVYTLIVICTGRYKKKTAKD